MRQGGLGDWDSERNIELQYSVHEVQHRLLWVPLAGAWSHCVGNASRRGVSASGFTPWTASKTVCMGSLVAVRAEKICIS